MMTLRRKLLVLASLVLPVLNACGPVQDTDPNASLDGSSLAEQHASVERIPPEVCPIDDPFCFPPPECDPVNDWGCEPCDRTNPDAWCYCEPGLITSSFPVRRGLEPNESPEVSSLAGTECNKMVITAIGARIVEDSNYATLWVEYRQPYADGTLGLPVLVKTGSQRLEQPERMVYVENGYVAVGLAVGQSRTHDVKSLTVFYRRLELTPSGVRLTGPILSRTDGNGIADQLATYYTPYENQVLVGVGLRSAVEQTKTIISHIGTLP
jgi:hypothetical protein